MVIVLPVIQLEASEARYTTAGAMSCGSPNRPRGMPSVTASSGRSFSSTSKNFTKTSVGIGPGATAFTRIPNSASSAASVWVKFSTAVLDKVYGPFEGAAVWVSMVEMFMIVPDPLSFMTFDAACAPDQTAFKLRSI